MKEWILFFFAILFVIVRGEGCDGADCTTCVEIEGCGWCASTESCMNSTEEGQPVSTCDIWRLVCRDPDQCVDKGSCETCDESLGCGWCDHTYCTKGNANGPSIVTCETWNYGNSSRCSLGCTGFTDCESCTLGFTPENEVCGWCNSTNKCVEGTSTGPNGQYQCSAWFFDICAGPQIDCGTFNNCSTCLNDTSNQCGWCQSTNTCVSAENASCEDFHNTGTCEDACVDFSYNCTVCNANKNCLWCQRQEGSNCVAGSASGPTYVNDCQSWMYETCPHNDTCPYYTDCDSCLATNGTCNWCMAQGTSQCLSSVVSEQLCNGELVDTCSDDILGCNTISDCEQCLAYPPGECVWCSQNSQCVNAVQAGTKCAYSCPSKGLPMGVIPIVAISLGGLVVVIGTIGLWYKFYWVKRHYYERLS